MGRLLNTTTASALDGNQLILEKGKFLAFWAASREAWRNSAQANALLCWNHSQINDLAQPKKSQLQPLQDKYVSITRHLQIARHTKQLLHGERCEQTGLFFFLHAFCRVSPRQHQASHLHFLSYILSSVAL